MDILLASEVMITSKHPQLSDITNLNYPNLT